MSIYPYKNASVAFADESRYNMLNNIQQRMPIMNSTNSMLFLLAAVMLVSGITTYEQADGAEDVEFTEQELAWLADNPTIVMGYNPAWAPYEYQDENGAVSGVAADFAERFSEISGSQFVQAEGIESWGDNINGIKDGSIDVLFTSWAERSPQRESFMDFTSTWLYIPTNIIIKESDANMINADNWHEYRVVIAQGYSVDVWLEENMPELEYTTADTPLQALEMIADDRADVHLDPWYVTNHLAIANGIDGLASIGEIDDNYELTIGYPEGSAVLGSILQKINDSLEDEKQQIVSNAINNSFEKLSPSTCR